MLEKKASSKRKLYVSITAFVLLASLIGAIVPFLLTRTADSSEDIGDKSKPSTIEQLKAPSAVANPVEATSSVVDPVEVTSSVVDPVEVTSAVANQVEATSSVETPSQVETPTAPNAPEKAPTDELRLTQSLEKEEDSPTKESIFVPVVDKSTVDSGDNDDSSEKESVEDETEKEILAQSEEQKSFVDEESVSEEVDEKSIEEKQGSELMYAILEHPASILLLIVLYYLLTVPIYESESRVYSNSYLSY